MLKKEGNLFFTWVPDLNRFRKNVILSGLWVHWVFKIPSSKAMTIDREPAKVWDGAAQFLCWVLPELPQLGSLLHLGAQGALALALHWLG